MNGDGNSSVANRPSKQSFLPHATQEILFLEVYTLACNNFG